MSESKKTLNGWMEKERLLQILHSIEGIKVAVVGDFCLDVYWAADMTKSELSRETPHFPLPVMEERMSPGAGGNVAVNIAALKPEKVFAVGLMGKDWRGDCLGNELKKAGITTDFLEISSERMTNAYCKPIRRGISDTEYEDPRIDFSNYRILSKKDEKAMLASITEVCDRVDILCIADQFACGCITPAVREKLIELAKQGRTLVADSRNHIGSFTDMILKPNEIEAYKAVYSSGDPKMASFDEQVTAAATLAVSNRSRVCMTLGAKGCIYTEGKDFVHLPACQVEPPVDICGAGDTFLSAFSCALAAGASGQEAIFLGNLAASVTVKKIGMTGTATPEEILEAFDRQCGTEA